MKLFLWRLFLRIRGQKLIYMGGAWRVQGRFSSGYGKTPYKAWLDYRANMNDLIAALDEAVGDWQ